MALCGTYVIVAFSKAHVWPGVSRPATHNVQALWAAAGNGFRVDNGHHEAEKEREEELHPVWSFWQDYADIRYTTRVVGCMFE